MNRLRLISVLMAIAVTCLITANSASAQSPEQKATIRLEIEDKTAVANAPCNYLVYVNGKLLGEFPVKDKKAEFSFAPKTGTNTLYGRFAAIKAKEKSSGITDWLFPKTTGQIILESAISSIAAPDQSPTFEFECKPGNIIPAKVQTGKREHKITIGTTIVETATSESPASKRIKVVFDDEEVIDKKIFTEPIELVEGVIAEYTLEKSYTRTVTKSVTAGAEAGAKGTASVGPKAFFGSVELTAEVKARIEATLGVTVEKTDKFTQKITVDGNKTPKLYVDWVHRYRKGTATLDDGTRESFFVCVGVRWRLRKE